MEKVYVQQWTSYYWYDDDDDVYDNCMVIWIYNFIDIKTWNDDTREIEMDVLLIYLI